MARFESGWQIFGFLLGAALVSLAVIQVLRIEAESRYGENETQEGIRTHDGQRTVREVEAYEEGFKERLKHRLQNFVNWFKTSSGKAQPESSEDEGERKKRSLTEIQDDEPLNPPPINIDDFKPDEEKPRIIVDDWKPQIMDQDFKPPIIVDDKVKPQVMDEDYKPPIIVDDKAKPLEIFIDAFVDGQPAKENLQDEGLDSSLIEEISKGHKIRHWKEKISKLKSSSPIVEAILSRFCLDSNSEKDFLGEDEIMDEFDREYPPMLEISDWDNKLLSQQTPITSSVCNSYGDLYLTICLTTVVNFSLMGLFLLCQTLLRNQRRSKRSRDFFSNNFDEHFGKEIFKTNTSEYSPIIKNFSEEYKI